MFLDSKSYTEFKLGKPSRRGLDVFYNLFCKYAILLPGRLADLLIDSCQFWVQLQESVNCHQKVEFPLDSQNTFWGLINKKRAKIQNNNNDILNNPESSFHHCKRRSQSGLHLNQTSVSYISDSVSHLAQEIVFCVKRFQEYGLEGHRTPGLIEQLAAERS